MTQKFQLGDKVQLKFGFLDHTGQGDYASVRVMPASVDGEVHYRVRGADGHERAIGESQINTKDSVHNAVS